MAIRINNKDLLLIIKNKHCIDCNIKLEKHNCTESYIRRGNYLCKDCLKKRNRKKYLRNKISIRTGQKKYELSNKLKIIKEYGGKCSCCGEDTVEFLTIDHINNDGAECRKNTNQGTGGKLYRWLIKNNYPKDNYQLLCYNCNCAKGFFGYCPHQNYLSEAGWQPAK